MARTKLSLKQAHIHSAVVNAAAAALAAATVSDASSRHDEKVTSQNTMATNGEEHLPMETDGAGKAGADSHEANTTFSRMDEGNLPAAPFPAVPMSTAMSSSAHSTGLAKPMVAQAAEHIPLFEYSSLYPNTPPPSTPLPPSILADAQKQLELVASLSLSMLRTAPTNKRPPPSPSPSTNSDDVEEGRSKRVALTTDAEREAAAVLSMLSIATPRSGNYPLNSQLPPSPGVQSDSPSSTAVAEINPKQAQLSHLGKREESSSQTPRSRPGFLSVADLLNNDHPSSPSSSGSDSLVAPPAVLLPQSHLSQTAPVPMQPYFTPSEQHHKPCNNPLCPCSRQPINEYRTISSNNSSSHYVNNNLHHRYSGPPVSSGPSGPSGPSQPPLLPPLSRQYPAIPRSSVVPTNSDSFERFLRVTYPPIQLSRPATTSGPSPPPSVHSAHSVAPQQHYRPQEQQFAPRMPDPRVQIEKQSFHYPNIRPPPPPLAPRVQQRMPPRPLQPEPAYDVHHQQPPQPQQLPVPHPTRGRPPLLSNATFRASLSRNSSGARSSEPQQPLPPPPPLPTSRRGGRRGSGVRSSSSIGNRVLPPLAPAPPAPVKRAD
ncbi:hypothetical protein BJ742DRAFT_806936 [Cladochytrium replicatum]|nr:hypothetical protein BJ742DRAFT_806936 [Cladochytrium replicatum]